MNRWRVVEPYSAYGDFSEQNQDDTKKVKSNKVSLMADGVWARKGRKEKSNSDKRGGSGCDTA